MALFPAMRLAVMLATDRMPAGKATIQVFEKLCLLAAANRLAAAGLIFTDCCLLDIYCFTYIDSVVIFAVDTIDY